MIPYTLYLASEHNVLQKITHNEVVISVNAYLCSVDNKTGYGLQPASCSMCPRALSPDIRLAQCEADHSVAFSTQGKNDSCYISTPHLCLQGMPRDNSISLNLNFRALRGM